jgi:hypothetical protein
MLSNEILQQQQQQQQRWPSSTSKANLILSKDIDSSRFFSSAHPTTTIIIAAYQWTFTSRLIVNTFQCQISRFLTYFIHTLYFQMLHFHVKINFILSKQYSRV